MLFLLRAAEAPHRALREIDESGTERAFWLFRGGAWLVCMRTSEGNVSMNAAPELDVELTDGGSVMVVEVARRPVSAPAT